MDDSGSIPDGNSGESPASVNSHDGGGGSPDPDSLEHTTPRFSGIDSSGGMQEMTTIRAPSQAQLRSQSISNSTASFPRVDSRSGMASSNAAFSSAGPPPMAAAPAPSASAASRSGTSRNPYYSAAAARASESIMESIDSDPEVRPPHTLITTTNGWSTVSVAKGSMGGTPPCERSLHSASVLNGSLYVFGGYNGQARVNDFHEFSFTSRRWSPVMPAAHSGHPPSPRDRHSSVVYGTSFYVFGGFDGTSRTNDFYGFDFSSMCWNPVRFRNGRPPSERHSHAAVIHDNCMYVFGGYDGSYK